MAEKIAEKHLSLPRLLVALLVLAGLVYGAILSWRSLQQAEAVSSVKPYFASYVDVTATPIFMFEQPEVVSAQNNLVLSFIVSSATDVCNPSWGNAYSLDLAGSKLDLDRRIARFRQEKGNVAISFGGQRNDELAVKCTDQSKLQKAYLDVIKRYKIDTMDLDIEGGDLKNAEALKRRGEAVAKIQKDLRAKGQKLAVWLTLPVSTQGLTEDGARAVSQMLSSGVDLAGVNGMTMDFGASKAKNQTMEEASEQALNETHRQLGILYKQAGINLNDISVWTKMGTTVMVGQNDDSDEIFTLDDAAKFNKFILSKGMARMSSWSANRDIACGENYVNTNIVSDSCSGVKQDKFQFAHTLGQDFKGQISANSKVVTKADPTLEQKADDPSKSPYQIWSESGVYLEGTRVVWHYSVYQAKWWTKGDLPDNPTLNAWQTPWQIIGPVLAGDKPIPQPTLPAGTYPEWSGKETYEGGQRVLLNGVPYQAKWWTQGDSPAASSSNPDSSPWLLLTPEQINQISQSTSSKN